MSHPAAPTDDRRRYRGTAQRGRSFANARTTASYTRFVRWMKVGLAVMAVFLVVLVLAYSGTFDAPDELEISFTEVQTLSDDLRMVSPRIADIDELGRPYTITAISAVQDPDDPSHIHLEQVEGDMSELDGSGWRNLSARNGLLDTDEELLDLDTDVALYTDDGFEFHAQTLNIDLDTGVVTSSNPVYGQGPAGSMQANAFRMEDSGKTIKLLEGSKVIIRSGGGELFPFGEDG